MIWLAFFALHWSFFAETLLHALAVSLLGYMCSYALVGPVGHWANLLLLAPLVIALERKEALGPFPVEDQGAAFEAQNWRAFALVLLLIPAYVGIWIWRTARRRLRGQQHLIAAILLLLVLFLWVESCPVEIRCSGLGC